VKIRNLLVLGVDILVDKPRTNVTFRMSINFVSMLLYIRTIIFDILGVHVFLDPHNGAHLHSTSLSEIFLYKNVIHTHICVQCIRAMHAWTSQI
jgi:hypothetical protein